MDLKDALKFICSFLLLSYIIMFGMLKVFQVQRVNDCYARNGQMYHDIKIGYSPNAVPGLPAYAICLISTDGGKTYWPF